MNIKWISIQDQLPTDKETVEICGHHFWGIAIFSVSFGFHSSYITFGRWENEIECTCNYEFPNMDIQHWRPIPDHPRYGTRGCDSKLMKQFFRGK